MKALLRRKATAAPTFAAECKFTTGVDTLRYVLRFNPSAARARSLLCDTPDKSFERVFRHAEKGRNKAASRNDGNTRTAKDRMLYFAIYLRK